MGKLRAMYPSNPHEYLLQNAMRATHTVDKEPSLHNSSYDSEATNCTAYRLIPPATTIHQAMQSLCPGTKAKAGGLPAIPFSFCCDRAGQIRSSRVQCLSVPREDLREGIGSVCLQPGYPEHPQNLPRGPVRRVMTEPHSGHFF